MRLVGEDAVYTLGTADKITIDDIEKNMVVVITMITIFVVYFFASIMTFMRDRSHERRMIIPVKTIFKEAIRRISNSLSPKQLFTRKFRYDSAERKTEEGVEMRQMERTRYDSLEEMAGKLQREMRCESLEDDVAVSMEMPKIDRKSDSASLEELAVPRLLVKGVDYTPEASKHGLAVLKLQRQTGRSESYDSVAPLPDGSSRCSSVPLPPPPLVITTQKPAVPVQQQPKKGKCSVIRQGFVRFYDTIRTRHAWLTIYYLYSPNFTRTQRLTILLNILITQAFTGALLYNTQSKGDGSTGEIIAFAIISTLTHWPVQKIFLGLFKGDIYAWWVSRSKKNRLEAKLEKKERKASLVLKIDSMSARSLKSLMETTQESESSDKPSKRGSISVLQRLSSLQIEHKARAELEDEEFLKALAPVHRGKLLELRQKQAEASGLRRYMYSQLVKEKEESLKKKLAGPVAAPMWNTILGYALSLLYVTFMRCV
jgi:hypothetical protein